MSGWIDFWHGLTPGQGTLLGGAFVVFAGVIAFSTGAMDRRSQHKHFHYQEMKTLYAEALRIGGTWKFSRRCPQMSAGKFSRRKPKLSIGLSASWRSPVTTKPRTLPLLTRTSSLFNWASG